MFKSILGAAALSLSFIMSMPAQAATMLDFEIDVANSSVQINQTGSGLVCFFTNCGIEASLASGLGGSFSLEEGQSNTFDFLTFTGNGTGLSTYDVTATLAFVQPAASVTGNSSVAVAALFNGSIVAGALIWDNLPQIVDVDGNVFAVNFQGGLTLLDGQSVTTSATVKALEVAPVPLPASALLLLGAVGGLAAMRKRKRA